MEATSRSIGPTVTFRIFTVWSSLQAAVVPVAGPGNHRSVFRNRTRFPFFQTFSKILLDRILSLCRNFNLVFQACHGRLTDVRAILHRPGRPKTTPGLLNLVMVSCVLRTTNESGKTHCLWKGCAKGVGIIHQE